MNVSAVRLIQTVLRALGHDTGDIDGDRGSRTKAAVLAAAAAREADMPSGWQDWSPKRQAMAFLKLWSLDERIDGGIVDGWGRPRTDLAHEALAETIQTRPPPKDWRDDEPLDVNPNGWPQQSPQSDVEAVFGPHGVQGGFTPPLRRVKCPWKLRVAWNLNLKTSTIWIHERCADSLGRVLTNVYEHYGEAEIDRLRLDLYGGSYSPRKVRGGTNWSMHAWGIALDWDPIHNRLDWGRGRASLGGRDYLDWWRFWEEEGWLSLGRTRDFDWMHVQAARL